MKPQETVYYNADLPLSEEGDYEVSLVAQGTTPQGNFTLQEDQSAIIRVVPIGAVSGKVTDEALYTKRGSTVNIPIQLQERFQKK